LVTQSTLIGRPVGEIDTPALLVDLDNRGKTR
jgi:hypothetical protein